MPRCAVTTFVTDPGLVAQTFTFADATGAFDPSLVIFQNAYYSTVNAVLVDAGNYLSNTGAGNLTAGASYGTGDQFQSGAKINSGGEASRYCILDNHPFFFFGGQIDGLASITNWGSGFIEITWALHTRSGDTVIAVVIGGDDLNIDVHNGLTNGAYATTAEGAGVIWFPGRNFQASASSAVGAGGEAVNWGWDTNGSGRGSTASRVINQGSNGKTIHTNAMAIGVDSSGNNERGGTTIVSSWGSSSYTVSGNTSVFGGNQYAFSGDGILCTAGSFVQRATAGLDVVDVGINPALVIFATANTTTVNAIDTTDAQTCVGFVDNALNQAAAWEGESAIGNVTLTGAHYMNDGAVLAFGAPNAASTVISSLGAVTDIDAVTGLVTVDWSAVGGAEPTIIWFALGRELSVPPTPSFHTRTLTRRRVRRSPLLWNEAKGLQTQVRVNLFAVDMQPGVGTADVPNPMVMIRCSKDGGRTWGSERLVEMGKIGEYTQRINAWQWGSARNWMFEVSVSDPVTAVLVNAYIDAEAGLS